MCLDVRTCLVQGVHCYDLQVHGRLTPAVRADVLNIKLDAAAAPGAVVGEDQYHIRLGAGASDEHWRAAVGQHTARVVRLEFEREAGPNPPAFFAEPFADSTTQTGFIKRLEHIPGIFCCGVRTSPGRKGAHYKSLLMGNGIEFIQ